MNAKYSLLFEKVGASTIYDLDGGFGVVCLEGGIPSLFNTSIKDMSSTTWAGEDGEDVYFPSYLSTEAFDWEVDCATKGSMSDIKTNISSLYTYFTSGGTELKVYSSYLGMGRQGAYLKSISQPEYCEIAEPLSDGTNAFVAEFKLTFRITDPVTTMDYKGGHIVSV